MSAKEILDLVVKTYVATEFIVGMFRLFFLAIILFPIAFYFCSKKPTHSSGFSVFHTGLVKDFKLERKICSPLCNSYDSYSLFGVGEYKKRRKKSYETFKMKIPVDKNFYLNVSVGDKIDFGDCRFNVRLEQKLNREDINGYVVEEDVTNCN